MNKNLKKVLLVIASVGVVASPLLAFASLSTSPPSGTSFSQLQVTLTSNDNRRAVIADGNGNIIADTAQVHSYPYPFADGTYSAATLWGSLTDTPDTYTILSTNQSGSFCNAGQTLSGCIGGINGGTGYYNESTYTLTAPPLMVPSVASSDIAAVGSPILGAFIYPAEWVLQNFGPPLFVILLVFAVFFAIYHRVKVGRWL